MKEIEKVEIFLEPQGFVKMAIQSGTQVGLPLHEAIPAAIQNADQFFGMGSQLKRYASNRSFNVQITDEKSDAEWAAFIGGRCPENTQWKRWVGETKQGRWNVIVFFEESKTPLMRAANNGHTEIVKQLLDAGADVNATDKKLGTTALHEAIYDGRTEIVRLLIDAGADVNAASNFGTALCYAARYGHTEIVRLLIDAGTDVNAASFKLSGPALHVAVNNYHMEIVRLLIDAGADVDAIREKNGDTALFIAARKGYTNVVIELLDRNADFTIKNEDGDTAIDWAKTKGHKYIVDILKKAGAKPKSFFSYFR